MSNVSGGIVIENATSPLTSYVQIVNNTFTLISSQIGIAIEAFSNSGQMTLLVTDNVTNGGPTGMIIAGVLGAENVCGIIQNNRFNNSTMEGFGVVETRPGTVNLDFIGNTFSGNGIFGLRVVTQDGNTCLALHQNTATNNGITGYSFVRSSGILNVENLDHLSDDNVGTIDNIGATSTPPGTCSCP